MNPFMHGVTVTGKDFCPRPELIADLRNHIDSQQNCVIRGVRRVGKTSAIIEAVRSYKKKGYIYINCWGKQDIHSLTTAIYEGFLIYQRNKGLSLEKIIRTFAHLRPKASIDPYSGEPTFSVDVNEHDSTIRSVEAVFDTLAHESNNNPLVVVLDEFQELLHLKEADIIMATLRGVIQLQANVTYFYLGSTRNLMDDIFNNPDRPFFKSASSVNVMPIERSGFSAYIKKKFISGKRTVSPASLSAIFDAACDVTGDVQQLCSEIWNCTDADDIITEEVVPRALARIHHTEHESNSRIIDMLSPGQVRVLVGIALVGGKKTTSKQFLSAARVAQPSSVTKALNRLSQHGLIYRDSEGYKFFSPFFRTWLLTQEL